jgi:hypothetical protein
MKTFLLLISLAAALTLGAASPDDSTVQVEEIKGLDEGTFPINVDFSCPRNFGFHIGDEIPVKVTLEMNDGPVVDLVNLPQKGETHGPFEVRDLKVHRRGETGRTIYTVLYQLQCFQPAIAVDKVKFPPLHISYATEDDWNPVESRYHYRTLYSQPFDIFVSRTASYFGQLKDVKGPIVDEMATVSGRGAAIVGGLMALAAFLIWPLDFIRKRRKVAEEALSPTARECALKSLGEARERCFNYEDHRKHLFFEISTILREFLRDTCGLSTANRPSLEILNQLRDHPFYEDLKGLVARINQVIYGGDAPADVESVMRQFTDLLERMDEINQPEGNHDTVG